MNEWRTKQLDDLVSSPITYGVVKPGDYDAAGVKLIRGGDIFHGKISSNLRTISPAVSIQYQRTILRGGELLVSLVGNPGEVALVPRCLAGSNLARQVGLVRLCEEIDPHFALYYFMSPIGIGQMLSKIMGSVQQVINLADLKKVRIAYPVLSEQKAIAAVLSSLDDKIDMLHRQNKTLETMAETLFRQWFVEEAEEAWETAVVGDVVSIKGGTTPSTKEAAYWDGNIHWTSPRDLSSHEAVFLSDTERKITEEGLSQIGSGLLPKGTVLLSSRAPIGYLAITDIRVAINQGYIAIVCDKQVSNYFMYLWCKANMETIKNAGNGSTFEEISKSSFKNLGFEVPEKEKLKAFDEAIQPNFEKIRANQSQIRTLKKLRDTLLPKLMSGEVRVAL